LIVMSNANKKSVIAEYQAVINALGDYPAKSFTLAGKVWKTVDVVDTFQAAIDAINAGNADKIAWQASVAKEKTAKAAARSLCSSLRGYIAVADGRTSNAFKTFGFAPTPAAASPATKVAAAKKTAATRKARGTLGKRQRKAIIGVVAPQTEPVVASKPVAATQPAGNGGSGSSGSGSTGSGGIAR
jgi:hypothetical protein